MMKIFSQKATELFCITTISLTIFGNASYAQEMNSNMSNELSDSLNPAFQNQINENPLDLQNILQSEIGTSILVLGIDQEFKTPAITQEGELMEAIRRFRDPGNKEEVPLSEGIGKMIKIPGLQSEEICKIINCPKSSDDQIDLIEAIRKSNLFDPFEEVPPSKGVCKIIDCTQLTFDQIEILQAYVEPRPPYDREEVPILEGVCKMIKCTKPPIGEDVFMTEMKATFANPNVFTASGAISVDIKVAETEKAECVNAFGFGEIEFNKVCASTKQLIEAINRCDKPAADLLTFHTSKVDEMGKSVKAPYTKNDRYLAKRLRLSLAQMLEVKRKLLFVYFNKCLSIIAKNKHPGDLGNDFWESLNASTGVFYNEFESRGFCSGVLVNGKLVTAGHCFSARNKADLKNELSEMVFITFDGTVYDQWSKSKITAPNNILEGEIWNESDTTKDLVAISMDQFPNAKFLDYAEAKHGERLVSIGNYDELELIGNDTQIRNIEGYRQYLAADVNASCMAYAISGSGCVAHACQTARGLSGSPILRYSKGDPIVLGLQTRTPHREASVECSALIGGEIAPNVAISLKPILE